MNATNQTDKTMVDVHRILKALWKKKLLIAAVSVLSAIVLMMGAVFFITPKYQADILVYVDNHSDSSNKTSVTINSGELNAARQLLNTYIVALKSRTSLDAIIKKADLNCSRTALAHMISANAVNETECFSVKVVSESPEEAKIIADAIADVLPDILSKTISGSAVRILDYAIMPESKTSPGYSLYAECGFIAGFLIIVLILALMEILNDKIQGEETLREMSDTIPVLANIPHKGQGKNYSRYSYGYGNKKKSKGGSLRSRLTDDSVAICEGLDFAQTEAYNLLQTSIQYSFSENEKGKVIGITSSERNEGKSTLAINLAYSLSCDKKKVLLLDGDMRLPSIAKKLKIDSTPGLSDYLTGKVQGKGGVQQSDKAPLLSVICAGVVPPNPFRLLGSASMEKLLETFRNEYDYIIVDLPPVNIVSDSLAIGKYLDGFVIAVRTEYTTRQGVSDVVKKLQVVNANILGFVVNDNKAYSEKKYGKYEKYGTSEKSGEDTVDPRHE